MSSSSAGHSARIKVFASERGFDLCRIVTPGAPPHEAFFRQWLARGDAAGMQYMHRHGDRRADPSKVVSGDPPQSIIVLGVDYHQFALDPRILNDPSRGIIASYAWGLDYHAIIRPLLFEIDAFIRSLSGRREHAKCLVDTGPVLERDWAQASGLGFIGKNCCTIHPERGSWLFLATMLVPEALQPDVISGAPLTCSADDILNGLDRRTHFGFWQLQPVGDGPAVTGTCGQCVRCMDACPTDAFVGPFHLDSRRCISYWTIETQDPIPRTLRPGFGNRIFGCDICQEVCPWNSDRPPRTPRLEGLRAVEERVAPALLDGFAATNPYWLDDDAFARQFSGSPIRRATRTGMLRNVCVALGNWASIETLAALDHAAADAAPVVRSHAAWATGLVGTATAAPRAIEILDRLRSDPHDDVRGEAEAARTGL